MTDTADASGLPSAATPAGASEESVPLVIIDDHPVVHSGIQDWLAQASYPVGRVTTFPSVGDFLNWQDTYSSAPTVIVYDPERGEHRPDYLGLSQLCLGQHRVIAYCRIASAEIILNCLDIGAVDYIVKSEPPPHLLDAIVAAQRGTPHRGPTALAAMQSAQRQGRPKLTARERRVLVAWLLSDKKDSVSQALHISPSTVRTHLHRIRRRYSEIDRAAPTKAALFARAVQDGLIGINDV